MSHNPLNINTLGLLGGVIGIVTVGFLSADSETVSRVPTVGRSAEVAAERPVQAKYERQASADYERPGDERKVRKSAAKRTRTGHGESVRPEEEAGTRPGGRKQTRPRSTSTGKRK